MWRGEQRRVLATASGASYSTQTSSAAVPTQRLCIKCCGNLKFTSTHGRWYDCRMLMDTNAQSPLLFQRTPGMANALTPAAESGKR